MNLTFKQHIYIYKYIDIYVYIFIYIYIYIYILTNCTIAVFITGAYYLVTKISANKVYKEILFSKVPCSNCTYVGINGLQAAGSQLKTILHYEECE